MTELDEVKNELHGLGREVAGLRPLVLEVHSNMPRIAVALETLARVTERLESNTEDHKRIHFRISENEHGLKEQSAYYDDLERRFNALRDEHIICSTTARLERVAETTGPWPRLKMKAAEKTVDLFMVALLGFLAWLVIYHLRHYPLTAPMLGAGG